MEQEEFDNIIDGVIYGIIGDEKAKKFMERIVDPVTPLEKVGRSNFILECSLF